MSELKELLESMWNKFLSDEAKAKYDKLKWAKDIYFDVQDFVFEETEKRNKDLNCPVVVFLKELIDTFYAIDTCDEKYNGYGAYDNVYNDMKSLIRIKMASEFYGVDFARLKQDGC